MPKFSIIATDYEFHTPRDDMRRGLFSIATQSFKDYELIIVHDGPKQKLYNDEFDLSIFEKPPIIVNTPERMNDFSHSSKDFGMRIATGEYIVHFNIDNILYSYSLGTLSTFIDETQSSVVIFSIIHHKRNPLIPFTGIPPVPCNIDAMQLVAKRSIWEKIGYWYDKEDIGDGRIYENICSQYSWNHINTILGENF